MPILFLLLICSSIPSIKASKLRCLDANCSSSPYATTIRYPFRLVSLHPQACGFPGFDLTCDGNQTVLNLPSSGNFTVQNIDYLKQEILLSDRDNCLPRRLLFDALDLSKSPFHGKYYQNFSLYNCTSTNDQPSYSYNDYPYFERVDCLSGQGYTVVCTTLSMYDDDGFSKKSKLPSSCSEWLGEVRVPAMESAYGYSWLWTGILLGWDKPECGLKCERHGDQCQSAGEGAHRFQCSGDDPVTMRLVMALAISFGGVLVIVSIVIILLRPLLDQSRVKEGRTANASVQMFASLTDPPPAAAIPMLNLDSPPRPRRDHNLPWPRVDTSNHLDDEFVSVSVEEPIPSRHHRDRHVHIEDLPALIVDKTRSNLPEDGDGECRICKEEYQPGETLRYLPCAHTFHAGCVIPWLRSNPTCPFCRTPLDTLRNGCSTYFA